MEKCGLYFYFFFANTYQFYNAPYLRNFEDKEDLSVLQRTESPVNPTIAITYRISNYPVNYVMNYVMNYVVNYFVFELIFNH